MCSKAFTAVQNVGFTRPQGGCKPLVHSVNPRMAHAGQNTRPSPPRWSRGRSRRRSRSWSRSWSRGT
eukprot:3182960-Rhodomonas_salina.1